MTDLAIRTTEIADRIGDVLDILGDTSEKVDNRAVAYAIAQQIRLRLDRALKASRDDIIVAMERDGLKQLGPVTIKSSAVDPSWPANDRDNWQDVNIQDALVELSKDERTSAYVRYIPGHLEVAVDVLAQDIQLGVQAAIDLYREANAKGWRKEEARRLSLAVREGRGAA
jgi:hypothetical protein